MTRALITGASGFVGSNLARRLCGEGWDVRCLVRSSSRVDALEGLPVEMARGSLDDAESLKAAAADADVVFHLAGRVAAYSAEEFERDNVQGTRNVAQACAAQATAPTMVFVSSLAAGGPGTRQAPRTEGDVEAPVSAYGRSKLGAERGLAEFAGRVPISVMRPPMVFGEGDKASLQLFRSMKFVPLHPVPWFRRFPLSLVHVADLCDGLVRVANGGERLPADAAQANGAHHGVGRYYVTTDCVTYGELGSIAAHAAGWAVAVTPTPGFVFWFAGAIGELMGRIRKRPTILNFDKVRETMAKGWVCSDAKLRGQLGYAPAETVEKRFAETVTWYRERGWL